MLKEKIKNVWHKGKYAIVTGALTASTALVPVISASAADTGDSGVRDSLKTGFTTCANDMKGAIGDILPIALGVLAAILVIGVGIKIFKRITGR